MPSPTTSDNPQNLLNYTSPCRPVKESLNAKEPILDYLSNRLPDYPFDSELDQDFVEELTGDFPEINILAEIKAFRWYYNNKPFPKSC